MSRRAELIRDAERAKSLGQLRKAIAVLDTAVSEGASDARVFRMLAAALHARGDVDRAIASYSKSLALERSDEVIVRLAALKSPAGSESTGIKLLQDWMAEQPNPPIVLAQLNRLRAIRRRRSGPDFEGRLLEQRSRLAEMNEELATEPVYAPSLFWQKHIAMHIYLLETYGIENFKRTVCHNYQNWLMTDANDAQVSRLSALMNIDFTKVEDSELEADDAGFHFIIDPEQYPSDEPLFNLQEAGPFAKNVLYPFYPLANPRKSSIYHHAVRALWRYTTSRYGEVMQGLTESEIGNPIKIVDDQKLISSDIAHSVREQTQILRQTGLGRRAGATVGELGAGHGRLAELFGRTTNFRYFIFDITPALHVAEWYLTRVFPNEKIFKFRHFAHYDDIAAELSQCRFAFFTSNQLALLPENLVDIFVNINSLMEMRKDQIELFLGHMGRVASQFLFCKQWIDWTNGIDAVRIRQRDFDLGAGWQRVFEAKDDIYEEFFTSLWRKVD